MGEQRNRSHAGAAGEDPAVVLVALAAIISVIIEPDEWDLYDSLVGVTLIVVLLAYGRFRRRVIETWSEAAAVGAVWAFCLAMVFGIALDRFQAWLEWPPAGQRQEFAGFWFCVAWLLLTLLIAVALRLGRAGPLQPGRPTTSSGHRPADGD